MLKNMLTQDFVLFDGEADTPEEAIRLAGGLLLKGQKIKESYIEAMVEGYKNIGPYIVLAPSIAIPHARPENGVTEQCVSFVRLKNPIKFNHPINDPVKMIFAIGGINIDEHMEMLRSIASLLENQQNVEALLNIKSFPELQSILSREEG